MVVNYFEIRQKIALALKNAGFRVKSPFKLPLGWTDVAAFKKESIGIDVCIANPASSVKRLLSYPFKHRIVLNLSDKNLENRSGCLIFDCLDDLQRYIGETFNSKVDFNISIPKDWLEFSKYFKSYGDDIKLRGILDALIFMYMSKEVLEEKADGYYFKALKSLMPTLKEFNLVVSSSKGIKPKFHLACLSFSGMKIAKSALLDRIIEKEEMLRNMIKKYGQTNVYIIFTAIQRDAGLRCESLKYKSNLSFKSLLLNMREINLHSLIKRVVSYKYAQTPLSILCYILTYVALYNVAVEIMEVLEHSGLASKVPIYSPYGIRLGEKYSVPAEVVDFILKLSDAEIDEDIVNEIVVLSLLLKTRLDEIEILQNIGIPIKKIKEIKGLLKDRNLVDEDGLKDSYENFLKVRIAKACERILDKNFPIS